MYVSEMMTKGVQCVSPETTLAHAARRMRDLNVGALPICGENDRLAGMVTDRDIAVRAVAEGKDGQTTPVSEVMTPRVVYCFDNQDIGEAVEIMEDKQVRRLLVLDRNKRLVGIVSLGDLAVASHDQRLSGQCLEAISEPAHA